MTKNFNTARSEYKRQLENLISSQAQAEVQNAGTRGQNALNQTASTVSAQIDPGKIDGVKYAETLAQGIAEIKAAQQKQLEEQLKQQAQAIKAQQKAESKTAKTTKSNKSDKSGNAGNGEAEESAALDNSAEEQEQNGSEQRRSATGSKDNKNKAETSSEKKGLVQKAVGAAAATASGLGEWLKTASPAEQQLQNELNAQAQNAAKTQADESTAKKAQQNAAKRAKAQEIKRNQASGMSNEALLKKEKLSRIEKEEIYNRVNNWLEEDPQNRKTYAQLRNAIGQGKVGDLLKKGYTNAQLDEANEYLKLYQKMGMGQMLKERVGNTALGVGSAIASALPQAGAAAQQAVQNIQNEFNDPAYLQATAQIENIKNQMQLLEDQGLAYSYNQKGQPVAATQQYAALQNQLEQAQKLLAERQAVTDLPVSKDTPGYQLYNYGQQKLQRSEMGLSPEQKFVKGAATSAAENIAIAMINPAFVLPVLSAQGAADSFAQSTENEENAAGSFVKGMAKGLAGFAINSVGVEQMLDTMGVSGARDTMAAQIVNYLKNDSVLSGLAQSNPNLYAVLMGATDNGLQSFAETWADYAIDLATNTAQPMSAEELLMESLQSMASGAAGGAMTAAAGLGVNAGRQAAYNRAQNARNAQMAPENAQNVTENAQNVTENAQAAQNEPAAAADNMKATGDNLPPIQPATDYKNTTVTAPAEQTAAAPAMRNDIIALKENLEQGGEIKPRIAQMFLKQGSTEEMKQRKQENRKALAQMLGVDESEIPTTLKAAREYLAKADASKLVEQQAQKSQSPAGQNGEMQSNAVAAGAAGERAGSGPVLRAVPMESVPEEMRQVAREISESTGTRVEYFESDNPRALGAYENGTLSLNKNLNTKEAAQQTIVHEFAHWMEGTNTYSKMRQYIMDSRILQEAARAATGLNEPPQGMNWAEAWQQKILEDYTDAGIEADAEKEMVAKLCEKYLFYDEDAVNKICRENMSLAETVLDWVREMISRVRGATMEAELRHIERLYRKGIAEAKKNAAKESGKTEYSYAGRGSKTANQSAYDDALRMKYNEGAENEEIRQATGWFEGRDGKWRYELDDSKVRVKDDLHTYGTLKEVIDAPELFAAYPDAENIFVSFENTNGKNGAYNQEFDSISLNAELKNDPEKLKSTLLHEMQHAIQNRESFASGANTRYWNRQLENGFDSRTAQTKAEEQQLQRQYEKMQQKKPEFVADMESLEKLTPDVPRGKVDFTTLEQIEPDPPEWVKYDEERERLEEKYGEGKVWDFQNLTYKLKQARSQGKRTAAELYRDTAGEVEARDVQQRRDYTAEERRQKAPDLGDEDTVFAGDGVAFSLSEENKSIADQLNDSLPEIMAMESVSKIPIDERRVPYTGDRKIDEKVARDSFREQGLNAYRPEFGNVELTMKGIKHSIYHGNSAAKQAAFAAVKDVIEQGKQIYTDERHKGNEFDTYTYAAPVELGYEKIGMAVVVKQTGNGGHPGYYIHEICDSKGNYIDLDENGNIIKKSASADLLTTANADADVQENQSPVFILLQKNESVNPAGETQLSISEDEGTVSREEISRGRFARAAKARENGDSMLRALFVEEDIAEETMRVMDTIKNESWAILRDTEESQRTSGQKALDRSANGIAWTLKREYHSSADSAGLKDQLIELYADMEGKNITMEEAIGRARKIGRELVQTARPERRANTELMDAYGDAYQSLTGQVIRITDSEMQSILHRWGSLREFRRDTGNKIRVSTEDGVPIDALWGELSETNPEKFAADTNDGDRVDAIANFVNEARPQEVQRYAGVERETAEEIGERIIDGFVDGKVRTEKERVRKEVQKEVRRQVKKGVERLNADNYEYRQELGKEKKKIERMAERMGRKLARPTKQQHIVADADVQRVVQSIADDALAIVTGRFAGEDKLPYVGQKLVALSNSLSHLATTDHRYAGFMTVDANGNAVPADFIRNLNDLAEAMNKIHQENQSISDLDLETARELRETLERVEHELEMADKLLSDTIGAEHRESAEKTAQEVYKEIDESRQLSTYNKSIGTKIFRVAGDTAVKYNFGLLNPTRIARMMTNYAKNSAFVEVADAINRGQRKMMLLKSQASAIFADVSNDEFTLGMKKENRKSKSGLGYTKADYDAFSGRNAQKLDVGFRDADTGEIVYITPAMRAELAMHLMNAHNRERVLYGGLMIPDAEQLCKGNTQEATKLSHRVKFDLSDPDAAMIKLADIVDGMSDYEAQWIKAAKEYFWNYSGKQYNKVTIDLWGYEAANVVNYYPAASDTKNLYQNVAQRGQANFTVENNSNMKERVYKARKPIALNEINRTARKSIDTMSRFCGLAMPMRDFEKIYNYQEQEGGKNIKGVMDRVWNGKASQYWEDVMADTNGSRSKVKDGIAKVFAKFRGNYATSVLYANASTAMKQAASFPTAAAAIGWKPLAEGLANYKNVGQETLTEINKRVATYSMRNGDGNSIYDVGDTSSLLAQTVNKLPGAGWITKADDATVKALSVAAKAYVDENIGNLQKGSTEYWDKVADVYADCIELTQPNNGTMQLSALSRSQSEVVRGVTMFSNQRIQNYGLMWDAVADLHAQQARLKAEPGNAELQAEVKRAKVKFANTMSAMAVQSLMIGLMTAAGKALWRKMDDYRDDTGEVTSKSFWTKIMWDSLGSFGSNFIGIYDIVDIGRYIADKDYMHFDFAVPELEAINDFVDKTRKFSLAAQNCWENEDPDKDEELADNLWKASKAMAEETGKVLGVPLVNIRKNVSGVWNGVLGEINGDGWLGKYEYTNENLRSMMDDYMAGSYEVDGINEMLEKWCMSKYGKAFGDMEKADRDTAASAMRDQAAKNWKDAYVNGTDTEREEIAEKLGAIRVGDRKLFTTKVLSGWVDSWENKIITQETQERAGQLFDAAAENLTGQKLYDQMSEEEQIDLEGGLNEAAKTAAKLEAGYMITSDLGEGEKYLYERTGKDKEKWLNLKAKYLVVSAQAKKVAQKGENGTGMAEFLRALEKSGYSTADMGALLQAKGGGDKLKNMSDEVRLEYYRAKNYYDDTDSSGSMNQKEFMAYVEKSGMKRSIANEIWNMIWKPGKNGSTSPYQ